MPQEPLPQPLPLDPPGQRIGCFELRELLGRGAMGLVYLAVDPTTGRQVALKTLRPERAADQDAVARFTQEAEAASRVDHPNVVRYDELREFEGIPYAVMELVEGPDLSQHVEREGPVAPALVLDMVAQIASGMEAIHRTGVVHRDVKPSNLLLVDRAAPQPHVKIADFGLARLEHNPITRTNMAVGTSNYMSPEQVLSAPVDGRTDVYGLGVVAFVLLTGELPFTGQNQAQVIAHHAISPAPPPSWLAEEVGPDVDRLVQTALRKSPEERFQSMVEMEAAAAAIAGGRQPRWPSAGKTDRFEPHNDRAQRILEVLVEELEG